MSDSSSTDATSAGLTDPVSTHTGQLAPKPVIDVAAGLILRADGSLLLAERPADKPWSGWWELPGGKIERGETVLEALARELKEELDIDVTHATPWVTYVHEYPKNIVRLAFCRVTGWTGTPAGIEGQRLAWVNPHEPLPVGPVLPATEPPLRWLLLPDHYLLTSIGDQANLSHYMLTLTQALQNGIKLVQFREPAWSEKATGQEVHEGFTQVVQRCHEFGAQCLVNSCHPTSWWDEADGVHLRASDALDPRIVDTIGKLDAAKISGTLNAAQVSDVSVASTTAAYLAETIAGTTIAGTTITETPPGRSKRLIGISAHTSDDLARARAINADFAVLGHVLDTPSHPGQPALGWAQFAAIARDAGLPVFAIGGQSAHTLEQARQHGAHGIAGIRYLHSTTSSQLAPKK